MTSNITVKIKKDLGHEWEENGKKYALYEVDLFNYGDHHYGRIQIEYQNESDLKEFIEDKSVKIEVGEDMTERREGVLIIKGGTWNADRTVWQKTKDTTKEAADKVGETSSDAVKKTGEGLEKAGKKLQDSSKKDEWPKWVLPVVIIVGVLFLIGIIAWIFKPKKR
ncbi:hypothetical protein [endosymbiont GvMRE of Glomus versiforme]|uniref:hypothetical protein n=1 Tax=endosymbiont GvMRE of Glomus versiforme TaxID=2039283 RepID=UPI000EEE7115|nr:hypothetical protein [endosymbiont GvMRE of Glomus versiforme]RHZ37795.1 hypothetical protein GvMRE_I1g411 [endosymbiont GvMRE of Glomus versiforme]